MIDINAEMIRIVQTTDIALRLISARLLTFVALVMTWGVFGWALYAQTTLGCIIASIWGLIVFFPILWTGRKGLDHAVRQQGTATPQPHHDVQVSDESGPHR